MGRGIFLREVKSREVILVADRVMTSASAGSTSGCAQLAAGLPRARPKVIARVSIKLRFRSSLPIVAIDLQNTLNIMATSFL